MAVVKQDLKAIDIDVDYLKGIALDYTLGREMVSKKYIETVKKHWPHFWTIERWLVPLLLQQIPPCMLTGPSPQNKARQSHEQVPYEVNHSCSITVGGQHLCRDM